MVGPIVVRELHRQSYLPIWHRMQQFTDNRTDTTADEIWLVEHEPVYTQGQAGKPEHVLIRDHTPIIQVDRGGQVTYHGPGQLMMYTLLNIKRLKIGVRQLVSALEETIVLMLADFDIQAYPKKDAPGVYVDENKICSIGLRIRKGCSFHGLALNVNMDLSAFQNINPCGYAGLQMINCASLNGPQTIQDASKLLISYFCTAIGAHEHIFKEGFDD